MTRAALACAIAIELSSCSALVGDYDLVDCSHDASVCDELNAQLPPGRCERYYCRLDGYGCELRARDDDGDGKVNELWDGIDNDCDNYIDEETEPSTDVQSTPLEHRFDELAFAVAGDRLVVAVTRSDPETPDLSLSEQLVEQSNGQLDSRPLPDARCIAPDGLLGECWLSELALAATSDVVVYAGVHTLGCGAGQLRAGAQPVRDFDLQLGEDNDTDQHGVGICVDNERRCTRALDCEGAAAPAIAVLPPTPMSPKPEALLIWQTPIAEEEGGCDGSAIAAAVLTVNGSDEHTRLSTPPRAGDVKPLQGAVASGAPAVVAVVDADDAGYLVAYPAADRIELRFVPGRAGDGALANVIQGHVSAEEPSDVALARGEQGSAGLALAYRARVDGGQVIQVVPLTLASGEHGDLGPATDPVTLRLQGRPVPGLSLSYAERGFRADDPMSSSGGWLVAWVEQRSGDADDRHLIAARVAEAHHRLLDPLIELAHGSLSEPFTYSKPGGDGEPVLSCGWLSDDALHLRDVSYFIHN